MAYRPQASYTELKRVEDFIARAQTTDDLRYIAATEGSKVGYKALGRLISGRNTAEQMQPEQAKAYHEKPPVAVPEAADNGNSLLVDACMALPDFFPDGKNPYGFQVDGIRFLTSHPSALLGDQMGLGKTIQAIGALKVLFRLQRVCRILILCPRPLVNQWYRELTAWAPELFAQMIRGSRDRRTRLWRSGAAVFITNYETWRTDRPRLPRDLRRFELVILDEIQKIKNPDTTITTAVRQTPAEYRWGLSGTPLENKIDDVVSIFDYLHPPLFRQAAQPYEPSLVKRLMAPHFLRRRTETVNLQLPDKVKKDVWLELNDDQKESYDRMATGSRARLAEPDARTTHVFAEISKLKQICNYDERSGTSSKVEYLTEELEILIANNQKALVFSQFPMKTLDSIQTSLQPFSPALFHGSLSDTVSRRMLAAFEDKPAPRVLLTSLKSGGTGLNLTSANHVFHFDHWWNPAVALQAEGRAHRIGQELTVFVHSMFTNDTIEERIYQLLLKKQHLFDTVIDELSDETVLGELSPADLFGLFDLEPPKPKTKRGRPRSGYRPTASYHYLKAAENDFNRAATVAELRAAADSHSQIGFKAICYLIGELSTPEAMKGR